MSIYKNKHVEEAWDFIKRTALVPGKNNDGDMFHPQQVIRALNKLDEDLSAGSKPYLKVFLDWFLVWQIINTTDGLSFEDLLKEFQNSADYKNSTINLSLNEVVDSNELTENDRLKREIKSLKNKLGYAYGKAYILKNTNNIFPKNINPIDFNKLWDTLEDCKEYYNNL